jgi:flagellar biosynthesis protein FlhG
MLLVDELEVKELHKARIACAYVFSPQLAKCDEFLKNLNLDTLKQAYRKKAKEYHPDLHRHEKKETANKRKEYFLKLQDSYELLSSYFQEKTQTFSKKGNKKGEIIAIGGAKGGIGKSIFSANLGVFLSNQGLRTVVVDLDLGGANLHLYVGETFLDWNINDFLNKRAQSLEEIMIKSKYGPLLIGGDSSQLGSTNINYLVKLKLLKAIKNIDADYVIIDLGGDTSYNILDFFLLADHGIIMTTCDPASYLDAYNFIKTALYRKLNRLFSSESKFRSRKDGKLEQLINKATMSTNGLNVTTIEELIKRVKKNLPWNLPILSEVISTFKPYLIFNRVPNNFDVIQVVNRIKEVSLKMLSIDVGYLGSLPYQPEIELSARNLVPIVSRYPDGNLTRNISSIVEYLL